MSIPSEFNTLNSIGLILVNFITQYFTLHPFLRGFDGPTPRFAVLDFAVLDAGFVAFAVRDFDVCCLAASAPVAITGGRHNAQNTKSDTVALKRLISRRSVRFRDPRQNKQRGFPPNPGLRDEGSILTRLVQQCLKKSGGNMTWRPQRLRPNGPFSPVSPGNSPDFG